MYVSLALLADAVNTTGDGKLNLLGVFDMIHATVVPCHHLRMFVVVRIRAEVGEKGEPHSLGIRLRDADGKLLDAPPEMPILFPEADPRPDPEHTFVLEMGNIAFPAFGSYEFEVAIDGERAGAISLYVNDAHQPV